MTDDWGDCRIPEGVLHAIWRTRQAMDARRRATPPLRDPDCPECHGAGVVKSFTHVYPCTKGCEA